jgi:hypothetical protein
MDESRSQIRFYCIGKRTIYKRAVDFRKLTELFLMVRVCEYLAHFNLMRPPEIKVLEVSFSLVRD